MNEKTTCTVYGERAETFKLVFGSNTVVIQSPLPVLCNLPGLGERLCYLLDMAAITPEQRLVLIGYIAAKFNLPVVEVSRDLDEKAMPILAEDCVVGIPPALALSMMVDQDYDPDRDDGWADDDDSPDFYDLDDLA